VLIEQARKLTAAEYLRRGFITPEEVGEDGIMTAEADPDAHHSTYYVAVTSDRQQVVATVRTIGYDASLGKNSFPLLRHHEAELDAQFVEKIGAHDHKNVTEVSALVRDRALDTSGTAAMKLYKKLFLDIWSKDKDGNSLLIMACNPELYKNFSLLFDGEMKKIGPDLDYPGQVAVPAMFSNREGAMGVIRISKDPKNPYNEVYRNVVNYFLSGSRAEDLHPDILNALGENGYTDLLQKMYSHDWGNLSHLDEQIRPAIRNAAIRGRIQEFAQKYRPEAVYSAVLLGYTALRTSIVGAAISPVSDVNTGIFLSIEVSVRCII
jgi:hypothetical protein